MKKCLRTVFLLALFAALLCVAALAADEATTPGIYEVDTSMAPAEYAVTVTPDGTPVPGGVKIEGVDVAEYYPNSEKLTVSCNVMGSYQLVLATNKELDLPGGVVPTESNIVYIDQNSDGSFTVYPSSLQKEQYFIYLSDASGLKLVATFRHHVSYTPGDVDESGSLSAIDALFVLQASGGLIELSSTQFLAADADKSGSLSAVDALYILQASAGLITLSY